MYVKSKIKNLLYFVLNRLGFLWKFFDDAWASILMYHSVADNEAFFTVKPEEFRWQMSYLKKKSYNSLFVKDLVGILSGTGAPEKTVALTFDDGYEDNYINVFPVLKRYGFKATVFLTTGYMGGELVSKNTISLKMLDWDQILEMHKSGLVDFQPHGATHSELDAVASADVEKEILESQRILEEKLNKKCDIFAYPRGRFNERVKNLLRNNGFVGAVSVKEGLVIPGQDIFALRRNSIDSSTTKEQFIGKVTHTIAVFNELFR